MRRVLFVIPSLEGGGAERQLLYLLRGLPRGEFAPELALFAARGPFLGEVPPDVALHDLGKRGRWDAPALVVRLRRLIQRTNPGVVSSWLWYANLLSALAVPGLGAPSLLVNVRNAYSKKFARGAGGWLRRRLTGWFLARANGTICPSKGVALDLRSHWKVEPWVIPNAVDAGRVEALSREPLDDPWVGRRDLLNVVAVGNLGEKKGYPVLVEAFALLAARRPDARLTVVGEAPREEIAPLRELAARCQAADRIRFVGFDPNPYRYLGRADLFAMASQYEGLPGVLLEALALGIPSIFTDVEGARDVLGDGAGGELVAPGDPGAFAAALSRWADLPSLREEASRLGRQKARTHYGIAAMIDRYVDAFRVLAGPDNFDT